VEGAFSSSADDSDDDDESMIGIVSAAAPVAGFDRPVADALE
jgi:hypothetical protein